ncbi:hypothetical protein D3C71_1981810 [compost metagenome]
MKTLFVEVVLAEFQFSIGTEAELDELDAVGILHLERGCDLRGRVALAGAGHAVVHF